MKGGAARAVAPFGLRIEKIFVLISEISIDLCG